MEEKIKAYIIHYSNPGEFTTFPLFEEITANSEEQAKEKFKIEFPDSVIHFIEEKQ